MALLGYVLASRELLLLAGLLATVYAVAFGLNRGSLAAVGYTRSLQPRRAFAGEPVSCTIRVENRRRLPLVWLTSADCWPNAVTPEASRDLAPSPLPDDSEVTLALTLRGRTQVRREYTLSTRRRGIYALGPAQARSTDPFGLFQDAGSVAPSDRLVVYPRQRSSPESGFASDDPFGTRCGCEGCMLNFSSGRPVRAARGSRLRRRLNSGKPSPASALNSDRIWTRSHRPISVFATGSCRRTRRW
jgi:hypothetical protein